MFDPITIGILVGVGALLLAVIVPVMRGRCSHNYKLTTSFPKKSEDLLEGHMRWIEADYDLYKVCTRCGDYYGVGERYG